MEGELKINRTLDFYSPDIKGMSFFVIEQFSGGQQCLTLSASPLEAGTESSILFNEQIKPPFMNEYAISLSQRVKGITPYIDIVDTDIYNEVFQEFNIVSIYQTTTTLAVVLDKPFDGGLGYLVDIWGLADNRFNYANLVTTYISTDKKTVTFSYAEDTTITSLTATPASVVGGKLKCQSLGANNFAKMRFGGIVNTRATMLSRFNQGSLKTSNALNALQYATAGNTNAYYSGATGAVELKPQARFKIGMNEDTLRFMDSATDSPSQDIIRYSSTEVKPSFFKNYRNRMRIVSPISTPTPIAKIVSAVKTGTTTATITTDVPHGLVAGVSSVNVKGVRDQAVASFPNMITPLFISSVVSPTVFTVVIGSAGTATSYGGCVVIGNGQSDLSGALASTPQTVTRELSGIVTISGYAYWTGVNIGEYVDLYGCLGSTGNALGLDGAYKVSNISTTTLALEPIKNLDGSYVLDGNGNQVTPSGGVITTTNCGGAVILRTTMRMHDITSVSYNKQMVQMEGQGISDVSLALPVIFPVTPSINITNTFGTNGASGVMVNPSNGSLNDIVTGAITSTTTSSSLVNTMGNGFQVTIPVTAVSGTNPTLDVRIEESFDNGTNWVTLYDFQRITATGSYNSPMLRATGSHIRYVRTVGGTSPSFTMSVNRNIRPLIPAEPQKRLIDRSIVLTTLDSVTPTLFQGAANNVQLIVSLGAATTPPVIQLEGSEDGVNWYAMGAPLTGVATKTVQLTVNSLSATYTRARVSTIGVTVTAGYVAIKAWS